MAGEKAGKNLLLKVDTDGAGTYATVGGLRSKGRTANAEMIDATNHGSNQNRELLDEAGIYSESWTGSGIHNGDGATLDYVEDQMRSQTLTRFQIVDDDGGRTYTGFFKITSFARGGEYNGEQTFEISLESSGAITVS